MDKFENDLNELDQTYYSMLLPSTSAKERRKTMISIIVEYAPYNKEINIIFHAGSTIIKNESFFLMKRNGYRDLSIHAAQICQRYLSNSTINNNLIKMPIKYESLYKFVNFFEKDCLNWQIEWITKWELKKVLENHHDLILNIESKSCSDDELITFFNTFEINLKKHFTVFK